MSKEAQDACFPLLEGSAHGTNTFSREQAELDKFLAMAPVFLQDWWLEAIQPGLWERVTVRKGGQVAATLPIVFRRGPQGRHHAGMPALTQVLGPWLRPSAAKTANRLAEEKDLMFELIESLPPLNFFHQSFHFSITNWLPFYWKGFTETTRYTYVLEDLKDLERVWANMTPSIRTDVRKAENKTRVQTDLSLGAFVDVVRKTFARQGLALPWSVNLLERLDDACQQRQARRIFFSVDAHQRVHAAVYLVWNRKYAFYLMGGGDPELRNSGATSLVLWEAIKFAATVSEVFDFEGSMIETVNRFVQSFGAVQKPYFSVQRDKRTWLNRGYWCLRDAAGPLLKKLR